MGDGRRACAVLGTADRHTGAGACTTLVQCVCTSVRTDGPGRQSPANSDSDGALLATVHGGDNKKKENFFSLIIYLLVGYLFSVLPPPNLCFLQPAGTKDGGESSHSFLKNSLLL